MKKSLYFAAVLIALGFVLTSDGFGQSTLLGGYKVIENTNAGAIAAADFAIKAQSEKTEMEFELGDIVKAERQSAGGTNYRLCMDVSANGGDGFYVQAVIYVDFKQNYKLTSWAASDCGGVPETEGTKGRARKAPAADGYKPIAKADAGAGLAADFAVKEQSAKTKTAFKLDEIVKAEDREPALMKRDFRLCLKIATGDKQSFAQAVVSMDQYSNLKLISWAESTCGAATTAKPAGGDDFTQVEKSDAGIGMAADFAVKKHSEETKIKHTLAGILKGENKGMLAMTYRVCMKITEDGKTQVIQAVVTMDQYSNMKLVSWEHSTCGN